MGACPTVLLPLSPHILLHHHHHFFIHHAACMHDDMLDECVLYTEGSENDKKNNSENWFNID